MPNTARRERIAQRVREALQQLTPRPAAPAPCLHGPASPCVHSDSCKHYAPVQRAASDE